VIEPALVVPLAASSCWPTRCGDRAGVGLAPVVLSTRWPPPGCPGLPVLWAVVGPCGDPVAGLWVPHDPISPVTSE